MDKKPQTLKEAIEAIASLQPINMLPPDVPLQEQTWLFVETSDTARRGGAKVEPNGQFPAPHRVDPRIRFVWLSGSAARHHLPHMKMPGTVIISDEVEASVQYNTELRAIFQELQHRQRTYHGDRAIWIVL